MRSILVAVFLFSLASGLNAFDRISFWGGSGTDLSIAMALDSSNNRYIAGNTLSPNLFTTPGAYQRILTPGESLKQDTYIAKYGESSGLLFSTFFGSSEEDYLVDIEVDTQGNVWVAGHCKYSIDFPYTSEAVDSLHSGGFDIFLAKFNNSGDSLLYSTLIGGSGDDYATSLTISPNGDVTVAGYSVGTKITKFYPTTSDALYQSPESQTDGVLSVIRADGSLKYSTYIGGSKDDYIQDIEFFGDSVEEYLAILSYTKSKNLPLFGTSYDPTFNSSNDSSHGDIFIQILNVNASLQTYATYVGGSGDDIPYSISVDAMGETLIVGGSTSSRDFPISTISFDSSFNGSSSTESSNIDGFIIEIDTKLETLLYSSYLGGFSTDRIYSVSYDRNGRRLFTGHTSSSNFPLSANAYQKTLLSKFPDLVTGRISQSGRRLSYSTLLGDRGSDIGYEVLSDKNNKQLLAGISNSTDLMTTGIQLQNNIGSVDTTDGLVAELLFPGASDVYEICLGDSIVIFADHDLSGKVSYDWFPKSFIIDDTTEEPTVFPDTTTVYNVIISNHMESVSKSITINVNTSIEPEIAGTELVYVDSSYTYSIANPEDFDLSNPNTKISWDVIGGQIIGNNDIAEIKVKWVSLIGARVSVNISDPNSCSSASARFEVGLNPLRILPIVPFGSYDLCEGDTLVLDGGGEYYDFIWNSGNTTRYDTVWQEGVSSYKAKLIANNETFESEEEFINVLDQSATPVIRKQGIYLRCLFAATTYQWYADNLPIPDATNSLFEFPESSTQVCYKVRVTIKNGCAAFSDIICIDGVGSVSWLDQSLYPNPANFFVQLSGGSLDIVSAKAIDFTGRETPLQFSILDGNIILDTALLSIGSYTLLISDGVADYVNYFVIQR